MSRIYITNGTVITKDALLKNSAILIDGSKISSIGKPSACKDSRVSGFASSRGRARELTNPRTRELNIIDAKGSFVSPGFIDTHIHGNPEKIFSNEVMSGTTSVIIALSCDRAERIFDQAARIRAFVEEDPVGSAVLGIRLEGPFINREKAGAQNRQYIKRPDRKVLLKIIKGTGGIVKIMTLAPELNGANALIKTLRKKGIVASIGHSNATYEEAAGGIDAGIRHATHIFNAMSGIDRRGPGAAGAALSDERISVEIILDLAHVHPALFKLLVKAKGVDGIILVTDSVRAEAPGYCAKATDGAYRVRDGRIAGSSLTMIEAVKNAVKFGGISLIDAVKMASLNAARLLGLQNRKGVIAAGKDADIVIFDKDFDVKMTIIGGEIVYSQTKV